VQLCWSPSTDDTGVTGYDIYRMTGSGFVRATSTTGTVGGFDGDFGRLYTAYVVARDAAGNVSPPSTLITSVATTGTVPPSPTPIPGDVTPPSQPTGLREGCLADYPGVAFCWTPSTDNVAVTAYDVYRETSTGWLLVRTVPAPTGSFPHLFTESGLVTGNRYTYVVVAKDAAGNLSTPSAPLSALARQGLPTPTPTPTPTPGLSCSVIYTATTWSTGLSASVAVRNTGTTAIDGWTLIIQFSSPDFTLLAGWSAEIIKDGNKIIAKNYPWNKVIQPTRSVYVGFNLTHTGTAPTPTGFTLNGVPCVG
jgi:cellulose 1,4-beta-cellobiosidase